MVSDRSNLTNIKPSINNKFKLISGLIFCSAFFYLVAGGKFPIRKETNTGQAREK